MDEFEVKFLEVDVTDILTKLESLGAKKVFSGEIIATFYDFPDKRLYAEKKIVRIRALEDGHVLTVKESLKRKGVKAAKEIEFPVDGKKMDEIFRIIGLIPRKTYAKHRESYALKDWHFELDTFPDVPTFLEIEGHSEDHLREGVKLLGLSMKDAKAWTGGDVLRFVKNHLSKTGGMKLR